MQKSEPCECVLPAASAVSYPPLDVYTRPELRNAAAKKLSEQLERRSSTQMFSKNFGSSKPLILRKNSK